MEIRSEVQIAPVADEVSAITAVVRPILEGILYSLKQEVVAQAGGYDELKLHMLARLQRPGDGDCGICFEYAVHDALNRQDAAVVERVSDALGLCKVPGQRIDSILFGAEKTGSLQLIDTVAERLTWDSSLLSGTKGRPVKLKRHINAVAAALRKKSVRELLPQSIAGLWKADLFLGSSDSDKWVGTTVKINPSALEGARGLRVGVVPSRQGASDAIKIDTAKNLVVCPMPYDGSFMEVFYQGWEVVRQFIAADAQLPQEVNLPRPAQREVARYLADRRAYSVLSVIEALHPLSQPHLLATSESAAKLVRAGGVSDVIETSSFIAPVPKSN
ncbi:MULTISPECIES: hypothetical protein [Streptomyces]|uniref:hypothetical protein n=1 Tax=Streptomyces TaxID=1883 RepID=UPI0034614EF9